jgi:hypothetical protein
MKETMNDYLVVLEMTSFKRLLVEGVYDKYIFDQFIAEVIDETVDDEKILLIDTVEDIDFAGLGIAVDNRKRVEHIINICQDNKKQGKIIGIVDRQFRELAIP